MDAEDPGVPTWVKVVGAITLLLIGAFVVVALAGGGDHGPDRHAPSTAPAATSDACGPGPLIPCQAQPPERDRVPGGAGASTKPWAGFPGSSIEEALGGT